MGAHNIKRAMKVSGKLTPHARLTLVVMALVSLDRDYGRNRARVYYAGHDTICLMLDEPPDAIGLRQVRRDVAELREAGIVEPFGWVDRHRAYRLRLPDVPGDNPVYNDPATGPDPPPT